MIYYHVCKRWDGYDLQSLYQRCNKNELQAIKRYAQRWPDAGELAQYHIMYVHCWDNYNDAKQHAHDIRGQILAIDTDILDNNGIDYCIDMLEFAHPIVRDYIPKDAIKKVSY
jgi:hypothetical protein